MKIDEKEEVLTIDAQGKQMILSGLIRPRDIDLFEVGVRCAVQFNEFHQPLHKGGSVLVKYLGSLAKNKRFCPIEEKTWYSVNDQLKENIVQLVPSRFVIPDDWSYNNAILTRVCKKWRQYRHDLKKEKFNPLVRTKEQIYNDVPNGQERNSWMHLVDHWYSEESQSLSQLCKEARASQVHVHITGATSYANKRVDFVKSKGRKPSHLEFFKLTHSKVDGSFVDNTLTSDFLTEATAKVQELANSSNPFSELEIENQVFDSLMYDQGKPRKLVGFGLGVKESDVFGVGGLVKKTMSGDCMNSLVEMENLKSTISSMKEENEIALASINKKNEEALESIKKENEELRAKMDQTNQILRQALRAMRVGTVTHHFLDTAQAALQMDDSHVASSGGENL